MKTLYIDCGMGAAGDMLTAALLELLPDPSDMIDRLNRLGIPDVTYQMVPAEKCGITGTSVRVLVHGEEEESEDANHVSDYAYHHGHEHHHEHGHDHEHDHEHEHRHHHDHDHDHEHHHDHEHDHDHDHHHGHGHHHSHRTLDEIRTVVEGLPIDDAVKNDILAVYTSIAEAEGHVHGKPVDEIHFHEVGTWDAVADVTAVSMILHELSPDEIIVSPIHVGAGHVHCAHGILPVPAPATAYILQGIPIYGGRIQGELCTPTGAALLKHFASRFGDMPVFIPSVTGYGMGKKDFPVANCVRAILGTSSDNTDREDHRTNSPNILMLSCNVDDMTAEEIGYAMEQLMNGGAREVFTTPVNMKKSRPGTLITVLCSSEKKDEILQILFRHTTTIGIREQAVNRYTLDRRIETVDTSFGPIRRKISTGYGVTRVKWEYDDLSRIASVQGCSIAELRSKLDGEFQMLN